MSQNSYSIAYYAIFGKNRTGGNLPATLLRDKGYSAVSFYTPLSLTHCYQLGRKIRTCPILFCFCAVKENSPTLRGLNQ